MNARRRSAMYGHASLDRVVWEFHGHLAPWGPNGGAHFRMLDMDGYINDRRCNCLARCNQTSLGRMLPTAMIRRFVPFGNQLTFAGHLLPRKYF